MAEGDRDRWTGPLVKQHLDQLLEFGGHALVSRLDATDRRLDRILEGFPQEYATKADMDKIRDSFDVIRADHVRRQEMDEVKLSVIKARDDLNSELAALRTQIALGPRELAEVVHQQAVDRGRQKGIGVTTGAIYSILTVLIAIGALIATALIATHR